MQGRLHAGATGQQVAWAGQVYPAAQTVDATWLQAWQRQGPRFVCGVNGAFALALQAGTDRLLYRDASSLQNLFWCPEPGGVGYASDLPELLGSSAAPPRIAPAALHEYLRFLDIAAPRTLYQGVRALEAGQLLQLRDDGSTALSRPCSADPQAVPGGFEQAVDHLRDLLRSAIELRLEHCRQPALFLSSGVDSALIAAIAAEVRPDTVALTVGFDDADFDESPQAAAIASRLRLAHRVLRFGRADLGAAFERCSAGMEQPTADPSLAATVLALDHCRQHFDAVLDGTGADEAVGALPARHLRLAVELGARLPPALRARAAAALRRLPALASHAGMIDFEHPADLFIRWGGFRRAEIERLCGQAVSFEDTHFYRTFERFAPGEHFERYSALVDAMPCERVNQAMRISGIHMRFPYCDRRVDGYLRQLPVHFRAAPGQPKRILRALLARYVPRELWDIPKRGFNFPLHRFLMADEARLVRQQLDPGPWRQRGLLDAAEVARHAQAYLAGDGRRMFRVWALVVLGAWLERHPLAH